MKPNRFYRRQNYSLERSAGFLINSLAQHINQQLETALKARVGISIAQWHALAKLHQGGPQTAAVLSAELAYDTGAMTRLIDRLEQAGLVLRKDDAVDRRAWRLALTKKGTVATIKGFALAKANLNVFLQDFTSDEAEQLVALLQKLKATSTRIKDAQRARQYPASQ